MCNRYVQVDKALMQEFTDELVVMASLDHPNVVAFYGASLRPPHLCLAMELCDGSLFDLLHRDRTKLSTYERLQVNTIRKRSDHPFPHPHTSSCLFLSLFAPYCGLVIWYHTLHAEPSFYVPIAS
jgi:serine/threonine protein kinase